MRNHQGDDVFSSGMTRVRMGKYMFVPFLPGSCIRSPRTNCLRRMSRAKVPGSRKGKSWMVTGSHPAEWKLVIHGTIPSTHPLHQQQQLAAARSDSQLLRRSATTWRPGVPCTRRSSGAWCRTKAWAPCWTWRPGGVWCWGWGGRLVKNKWSSR